jgi:AcrR family transcriptional regulator
VPLPSSPSQSKHRAIVDAATREFLRRGFTETSVDAVAAEAGVAKQTVYNHFGDKAALFRAVIRATLERVGAADESTMPRALAGSDDIERDLRRLGHELLRGVLDDELMALRRLLIAERDRHPELLDEWGATGRRLEADLAMAIDAQTARGALDVADAALAAHQFVLLIAIEALGRTLYGLHKPGKAELDAIVDHGVTLWLRAYRPR